MMIMINDINAGFIIIIIMINAINALFLQAWWQKTRITLKVRESFAGQTTRNSLYQEF